MLSLLIAVPVVAAGLVLALPSAFARRLAFVASLLGFVLGTYVAFSGGADANGFRWVENKPWFPSLGIHWHLGIDGLAGLLVWLTSLLTLVGTTVRAPASPSDDRIYWSMLLLASAFTTGAFVSLDLVLFYAFFEACLIPVFVMMGTFGRGERAKAALVFVVYTVVASLVLLAGLIALRVHTGSFDWDVVRQELASGRVPTAVVALAFAGFVAAFAVKSPVFPLHSWLPDAYRCAPPATAALLAGAMAKLGTFGFVRYVLPLFPNLSDQFAPAMVWLGVAGIVYGALNAAAQRDFRGVVAYSSVSHLGYVIAGIFSGAQASVDGAALQMINHGVTVGALFLLVGHLEQRWNSTRFSNLGGIWISSPLLGRFLLIAALSAVALPLTNGFVGELLVLVGLFQRFPIPAIVAVSGALLSAIYMLLAMQRLLFGPVEARRNRPDLRRAELAGVAVMTILVFVMGIVPGPFLATVRQQPVPVADGADSDGGDVR